MAWTLFVMYASQIMSFRPQLLRHLMTQLLAKVDAVVDVVEEASEEGLSFVEADGSSLLLAE